MADEQSSKEEEILKLRIKELELKKEILELEQKSNSQNNFSANKPSYLKQETNERSSKSSDFIRGPRGGCYTIGSTGRKRYVDRSLCD